MLNNNINHQPNPEHIRTYPEGLRKFGRGILSVLRVRRDNETVSQPQKSAEQMEIAGFAKDAPTLENQFLEDDRRNMVESNGAYRENYVRTMGVPCVPEVLSESDSLKGLYDFLAIVTESDIFEQEDRDTAADMMKHLTIIGEKEMKEATQGMAAHLKRRLDENSNRQLLIQVIESASETSKDGRSQKSAGYVLRNVFDNFSEEEVDAYGGRIIFYDRLINPDMEVEAILLDDWSTSNTQMRQLYHNLTSYSSVKIDTIEACLVAAPEGLIEKGMKMHGDVRIPVRSYYKLAEPQHHAPLHASEIGDVYPGYVTGSHSSVDFNIDRYFGGLVKHANVCAESGEEVPDILLRMPPLAQVTRPYLGRNIDHNDPSRCHPRIEQINKNNGSGYFDIKTGEYTAGNNNRYF